MKKSFITTYMNDDMTMEKILEPMIITREPSNFSEIAWGKKSPYPTVDSVVSIK